LKIGFVQTLVSAANNIVFIQPLFGKDRKELDAVYKGCEIIKKG
jgi:hypothetical protein